jgi:hypothetical protein
MVNVPLYLAPSGLTPLASEQARITHLALANFRLRTCYHNQTLKLDENESKGSLFPLNVPQMSLSLPFYSRFHEQTFT